MMKQWIAIGLVTLAAGAGCEKKKTGDTPPGGGGGADTSEMPEPFAAWMPKGVKEAWQGVWKTRMTLEMSGSHSLAGDPVALELRGDKAKVFDGKKEYDLGFSVTSPCTATFTQDITEGSMKGGTSYHEKQYVIADGKLVVGDGGAGMRKAKAAFVCVAGMDGGIYVLDDKGTCAQWKQRFGKWESSPAKKCAWSTAEGKELLTIGDGDWATKVYAKGDLLVSEQFEEEAKLTVAVKDYAAEKAAVIAKNKADDPGEQAKAAGGKLGDLTTVLGITASLAADKSLKGKPIELTAQYLNSNTSTSGDKTYYSAVLVDNKDTTKFTLYCDLKAAADFVQFTRVIVKGTLDESIGPTLKDCTLAKAP